MAGYGHYQLFKITEMRDGCVYKTQEVGRIWLPLTPRTPEEENRIAKLWKADILASPDPKDGYDFEAKDHQPMFHRNIVANLRMNNENLREFTDDQIYNAYEHWSISEDHPDESLIKEWIGVKE